ncbi:MAG: 2-C-methyl-D-erythritol 4-phosphate cytidylyltransferase, partial [Acidobacteriales bacterium]|nr:2-C-methyl-D-erythritol 4-phosphate cytidylyltransferase [Terriglobales bacterium]
MKVIVIIPAAGLGTRMSSAPSARSRKNAPSKQFTEIGGTPILLHTLRKIASVSEVSEIVIALRQNEIENFRARLPQEAPDLKTNIRFVAGGEHRQHSVANALNSVALAPEDLVLVHDAVRPFVSADIIRNVIDCAHRHGAAVAAMPAVDTVKQVERTAEGATVTATLSRERIVMAQTPQGFRYDVLKKAFDEAAADGFLGTDESS